jgi:hypothetical protein
MVAPLYCASSKNLIVAAARYRSTAGGNGFSRKERKGKEMMVRDT